MDESKLTLEQMMDNLDDIVRQLESDDVSLEDSFKLYEQGVKLVKYCNDRIDRVEKKVKQLNADGSTSDFAE